MRQFSRNSTDIPVNLEIQAVEPKVINDCKMISISLGGLRCEIDEKVKVGCKLNINVPSVSPAYDGVGEVVWCASVETQFEIGVRFVDVDVDETKASRMVQQVCQIEHYKNIVFDREGKLLDGKQAAEQWIQKHII